MTKKFLFAAVAAATTMTALPAAAQAQYRDGYRDNHYSRTYRDNNYYGRTYRDDNYYGRTYRDNRNYNRRCSGTTGTIVGGAGGALLGRSIGGRGDRTLGTILGGAAGALLGREVGKSTCRSSSRGYRY